MKPRLHLVQRIKPMSALRLRMKRHASTFVISALVLNLFIVTYAYLNLGMPKKAYAGIMTAVADGNWTSSSTWSGGRMPKDGDTLSIPAGRTVLVDVVTQSYNHILIVVNGTLYFNGGKKIIMCEGMVVVGLGGLLSAANAGSKFEICGSFLWDGNDPGAGPLVFGGFTTSLPVDLAYFKAAPENRNVNLQWETVSQVNCDYFLIERSTDGSNFSPVTNIKGKGNSSQRDVYHYIDTEALDGTSYYRLKEVDFDGTSETFNTVSVNIAPTHDINVYPNPVAAGNAATVEIPFADSQVEVSLINIEGKKIFSKIFGREANKKTISFQTDAFPLKGTFLLVVASNETKTAKKIFVM